MTTEADALILRYLQHLESQLGDLPANRRQELLDEVQEHITTARADLDPETEAGVLTLLERLGDPADIAAEARDRSGVQAQPARPATPWLEITTIVLLVIPFLGWVLGAVLVWLSRLWTTRDKLVGTVGGLSWVLAAWGPSWPGAPTAPSGRTASTSPPPAPTRSRSSWSWRRSFCRWPPPSTWGSGCGPAPRPPRAWVRDAGAGAGRLLDRRPPGAARTRADGFLRRLYREVAASASWRPGILLVTFDEGISPRSVHGRGGHVATIVAGPGVRPGRDPAPYSHYVLLRSIERRFGLPPLRNAADPAIRTIPVIAGARPG